MKYKSQGNRRLWMLLPYHKPTLHGTVVLTLCDLGGRELRHEQVTGTTHRLDIATLPAGVYLLKFTTPQGVATRRLLVE